MRSGRSRVRSRQSRTQSRQFRARAARLCPRAQKMRARRSLAASAHGLSDSHQLATLCASSRARTRDETRSLTERGSPLHARKPLKQSSCCVEQISCPVESSSRSLKQDQVSLDFCAPIVPAARRCASIEFLQLEFSSCCLC